MTRSSTFEMRLYMWKINDPPLRRRRMRIITTKVFVHQWSAVGGKFQMNRHRHNVCVQGRLDNWSYPAVRGSSIPKKLRNYTVVALSVSLSPESTDRRYTHQKKKNVVNRREGPSPELCEKEKWRPYSASYIPVEQRLAIERSSLKNPVFDWRSKEKMLKFLFPRLW